MTLAHTPRQVLLKKKEDRRIRAGHPWVFSNEIQETRGEPAIGDVVQVLDAGGRSLGTGLYNPHSLISVRLVSRLTETLDLDFFRKRLMDALLLRQRILPHAEAFRVVHGESDFLPGLVVDKFNDYLALQTFSYGMDARMGMICDALEQMFSPTGIIERNESPLRQLDGLPERKGVVRGTIAPTTISEHGIRYRVDLLEGQKTGFFLDQRENRQIAAALADGCDVLDCFCNDGGFALNAARGGARSVLGIDVSADAVARARANATLNSLASCSFERGDVFERLASLHAEGSTFDMVILDPPSFTRSRKHVQMARIGSEKWR